MTETAVRGKTLIVTTTNGTKALLAAQGAAAVYAAGAANLTLAAEKAREVLESDGDVLVVCAGRDGAFSLDDAYCAGRLAAAALGSRKPRRGLNDAAIASLDLVRRYGDRLGAPAQLQPRGPGAHPSGLPRRRARRGPARRVPRAGAFPRPPGDARTRAGMSSDSRRRLGAITALVAGLFVGLTLLPFRLTGPIGHSLGQALWQRARRGRARHSAAGHRARARGVRAAGHPRHEALGVSHHRAERAAALSRRRARSTSPWPTSTTRPVPGPDGGCVPGFFAVQIPHRASAWPARCWRASWRSAR